MTQEEKDIIYRDACCRLFYHPYAAYTLNDGTTVQAQLTGADDGQYYGYILDTWGHIPDNDVRLYLRPMSSITKDEEEDLRQKTGAKLYSYNLFGKTSYKIAFPSIDEWGHDESSYETDWIKVFNWLDQHHFDYQDLINKGLALKAPEEMYKI